MPLQHDRRPAIFLVILLVALFTLMAGQVRGGAASRIEELLLAATSPLLRGARALTEGTREAWNWASGGESPRSRRELEERVAKLELERQLFEEERLENARLRALLDLKQGLPVPTVAAAVLANSFRGPTKTCLIDRGSKAGLSTDMPVVNSQGVVGRLWSASARIAKVQLLIDASSGAAVLVQRTRVQGVLVGRGDQILELRYVSNLDDVKAGDLLLTSGQDGIYPRGLPAGVVAEVQERGGPSRDIKVIPRVDFDRIEEVLVLTSREFPRRRLETIP